MTSDRGCRECGARLIPGENWAHSRSRQRHYICSSCCAAERRARDNINRERVRGLGRARSLRALGVEIPGRGPLKPPAGHSCAICGARTSGALGWVLDHDHKTRQLRGWLCNRCNLGLGQFRDSPEILAAAIEYLNKWKAKHQCAQRAHDNARNPNL